MKLNQYESNNYEGVENPLISRPNENENENNNQSLS